MPRPGPRKANSTQPSSAEPSGHLPRPEGPGHGLPAEHWMQGQWASTERQRPGVGPEGPEAGAAGCPHSERKEPSPVKQAGSGREARSGLPRPHPPLSPGPPSPAQRQQEQRRKPGPPQSASSLSPRPASAVSGALPTIQSRALLRPPPSWATIHNPHLPGRIPYPGIRSPEVLSAQLPLTPPEHPGSATLSQTELTATRTHHKLPCRPSCSVHSPR